MSTLKKFSALGTEDNSAELGFGIIQHIEAIKKTVEAIGIEGIVSLISALIACYSYDRKRLLAFRRHFLPASHHAVFRELLDLYQGDDPGRHRWTRRSDGTYALLT